MARDSTAEAVRIPSELVFLIDHELRVFPLKTGTKGQPLITSWPERASDDPNQIVSWLRQFPSCNWGFAPGKDEIILDYDGEAGQALLEVHQVQFGPFDTPMVKTRGGGHDGKQPPGTQVYWHAPGHGLRNGVKLQPGLDLRVRGGYGACPPSQVVGRYEFIKRLPPAPIPTVLLTELRTLQAKNGNGPRRGPAPPLPDRIPDGERNADLTSLAGSMRRRNASTESILAALHKENKRCDPPLPNADLEKIAGSVGRYSVPAIELMEHLTDLGNAKLFADQHRAVIRYLRGLGYGLFDGQRWKFGDEDTWSPLARATVTSIYETGLKLTDENQRKKIIQHALNTEKRERFFSIIRLARTELGISVDASAFDSDPWLLNVLNGTVDLRTGLLRPHSPADLLTHLAPTEFRPELGYPQKFLTFLYQVTSSGAIPGDLALSPDRPVTLADQILDAFGYALTGSVKEEKFFILYGQGSNGKTKLMECVQAILGDYADCIASRALLTSLSGNENTPHIAKLPGKRLVWASETKPGAAFDLERLKDITGGDTVTAMAKYANPFTFKPQFKIFFRCNHLPRIVLVDEAVRRRFVLLPFELAIPEKDRDTGLLEKLLAERSQILTLLLERCLAWQERGSLLQTDVSKTAASEYLEAEDLIQRFVEELCTVNENAGCPKGTLYRAFQAFAGREDPHLVLGQREFNRQLGHRLNGKLVAHRGTGGIKGWVGIGLKIYENQSI